MIVKYDINGVTFSWVVGSGLEEDFSMENKNAILSGKKTYQEPILRVYGDLLKLTETASNTSHNADGGSMAHSKTS